MILFSNVGSLKRFISSSSGELELDDNANCTVEFKSDNAKTQVNESLVGLLVAGGISNNAMIGRAQETSPSLDDYPDLSDIYKQLLISIRDYDDPGAAEYHLCFIDSSLWKNDAERYHRTLTAPDSLISSSKARWNLALAIYNGVRWFVIPNTDIGDSWSDFSVVNEYSTTRIEELCIDQAINVP